MAGDQSDVGTEDGGTMEDMTGTTINLSIQDGRVNCFHISKTSVFKTQALNPTTLGETAPYLSVQVPREREVRVFTH